MNVMDALKASAHKLATRNPGKSWEDRYARLLDDGRFQARPDYGDKWKAYESNSIGLWDDWEPYCQWVVKEECTEESDDTIWAGWDISYPWDSDLYTSCTYFDIEKEAEEYFLDVCVQLRPGEARESFRGRYSIRPREEMKS